MKNERFQLQNVAKRNGSFQLQNAANSKENGQNTRIQKTMPETEKNRSQRSQVVELDAEMGHMIEAWRVIGGVLEGTYPGWYE